MDHNDQFYIGGEWVAPHQPQPFTVINPADESPVATIHLGGVEDVNRAVAAAKSASNDYSRTERAERIALLKRIVETYQSRIDQIARTITLEMGAPLSFSREVQCVGVVNQFNHMRQILESYEFEHMVGTTRIVREPIGVCALITAWNWPLNLIAGKIAPALATGCTVIVKPSEFAPLSSILLAEVMHDAGVPAGVFNLIQGNGPVVGAALASHPDVEMVSFTGSTRGGIAVAEAAARTVKRVHQELGGKSAHLLMPDAALEEAVPWGIFRSYMNSGQSCEAPTRMFVHREQIAKVSEVARSVVEGITVGDPLAEGTRLGPLVNQQQFDRVQNYIESGIDEGATLLTGGPGRPEGLARGYYVRPTVFTNVRPSMKIAAEEIFGPVLSILPYDSVDEAIAMANDSVYGLAAYVHGSDRPAARKVASQMKAGRVYVNGAPSDIAAPFGGYKQSGNGRQNGIFGFEEYLEVKAVLGY